MSKTLRSRQQELARQAIVDVAAGVLRDGDPDTVSLADVAAQAGVSERTLYRYFSTRDDLIAAAAQHLVASLGLAPPIEADDIVGSFRKTSARMAQHPQLLHNLLRTRAGGHARGRHREGRARQIIDAVRARAPASAPVREVDAAGAVVTLLCSATAWSTVRDEAGIPTDDAQCAVAWAIDTLLHAVHEADLPELAHPRRTPPNRKATR